MNQELPQPKDGDLVLGGFEGTKRTLRSDSNEEEKMDTKEMVGFYGYREGEDIAKDRAVEEVEWRDGNNIQLRFKDKSNRVN